MKIIESYTDVINTPWKLGNNILLKKNNEIINLGNFSKLNIDKDCIRCFYSNNYIYVIKFSSIKIFNEHFNLINDISIEEVEGITIFDENNYIIRKEEGLDDFYLIYQNNSFEKKELLFYGGYYDNKYRIENIKFDDVRVGFRLSNILDTNTYFEFQCDEGYELHTDFYIWKDSLIFMYYKDTELILEQKELPTGKTLWKIPIEDGTFCFDKERGIMASIWGKSGMYDDSTDQYQTINLNTQTIEIGSPAKDFKFAQVESHMGTYLHGDKLYFSDNPFSYAGKEPNAPSVGCFDIKTKKVDFIQEIPEMAGSSIADIIYNNKKLYVRSSNGDLIAYQV